MKVKIRQTKSPINWNRFNNKLMILFNKKVSTFIFHLRFALDGMVQEIEKY
jgi:ribosomal protein L30/L7E